MRATVYASRGRAVELLPRDARELGEQEARPAEDVVLADVGPHAAHARATVVRVQGHGAMDGGGHVLDVVGVDHERIAKLVGCAGEPAQDQHAVLVIFQAMDAAGKDGAIRHVMSGINPQGCQVYSFKAPSAEERDHTYLWRSMKALPERGRIGIHNRSYYEEVLVVRVHEEILAGQQLPPKLVDRNIWQRRFREINDFERHLTDNGTTVVKFFLHVSKAEQKRRFLDRIDDEEANWKFSIGDVKERQRWDEYMRAYEAMLSATSTTAAPWYVVPADVKWFTRVAVASILWQTLADLDPEFPQALQPELPDQRLHAPLAFGGGEVEGLEDGAQVVLHRQAAEDRGLLRQIADAALGAQEHRHVGEVDVAEQHLALVGRRQAHHHVEGSGLAGAVGAEQADHLAGADVHRNVVDHVAAAVGLAQVTGGEGDAHGWVVVAAGVGGGSGAPVTRTLPLAIE